MSTNTTHMRRALELARLQQGRTASNPSVGCVILDRNGDKISEAATGDGGRPHAEQLALSQLDEGAAKGGTAYVTLEPCRQRSTDEPSCSERLIDAGIARVVVASLDPHPLGKGGNDRLQGDGVDVEVGLLSEESDAFYADFFAAQTENAS
ncbi:MAG: bifunctional diaminohydroxyphosphoribosylaminopyrimidine deaminase/5-amino-6-(5-phosphoribosylamino)uracil reductase RibD [Pseudomonadota bacterium]